MTESVRVLIPEEEVNKRIKEMAEKINALNGRPLSEARKLFPKNAKNGYGVSNVLTRLRLKYGEEILFTYRAEQDGTTCTIEIPGEGEQHEENS